MNDRARKAELEPLKAEVDKLRITLKAARDAHNKDAEKLERLERTIALVDHEIALAEAGK